MRRKSFKRERERGLDPKVRAEIRLLIQAKLVGLVPGWFTSRAG